MCKAYQIKNKSKISFYKNIKLGWAYAQVTVVPISRYV